MRWVRPILHDTGIFGNMVKTNITWPFTYIGHACAIVNRKETVFYYG